MSDLFRDKALYEPLDSDVERDARARLTVKVKVRDPGERAELFAMLGLAVDGEPA